MVRADTPTRSMRSLLLLATAAMLSACQTLHHEPPPPEFPYVIGPAGRWTGNCTLASTPPGSDRELSGCITEYMFIPGSVIVTVP